MAVSKKFQIIDRKAIFDGSGIFSPEARAKAFAAMARASIAEIDASNDAKAGRDLHFRTFVDGRETIDLERNTERSEIVARWELGAGVVDYIAGLLAKAGPVRTGRYRASVLMYADGVEIDVAKKSIGAREVLFVSSVPYARKIERGKKGYAPGKVYEAVAAMANARFSNIARIKFTYAEPEGYAPMLDEWARGNASKEKGGRKQRAKMSKNRRNPAIIVYLT
jgi:hypothetical protein